MKNIQNIKYTKNDKIQFIVSAIICFVLLLSSSLFLIKYESKQAKAFMDIEANIEISEEGNLYLTSTMYDCEWLYNEITCIDLYIIEGDYSQYGSTLVDRQSLTSAIDNDYGNYYTYSNVQDLDLNSNVNIYNIALNALDIYNINWHYEEPFTQGQTYSLYFQIDLDNSFDSEHCFTNIESFVFNPPEQANYDGGLIGDFEYNLPENPTREGYTFIGWFYDNQCMQEYNGEEITEDTILYAGWQLAENAETTESIDTLDNESLNIWQQAVNFVKLNMVWFVVGILVCLGILVVIALIKSKK